MPLPWARLGLANAAVLVALGMYGPRSAALVGVSKLFLVGLLTGALVGPGSLMGLAGTAAAIAAMSAATYLRGLSAVGWSAAGAIAHIVAQFGIAAVLTGTPVVWALLPISMCVSLAFGVAVGLLARTLLSHLPRAGFAIR
jgi:heptaprenyl diphosphate synthase